MYATEPQCLYKHFCGSENLRSVSVWAKDGFDKSLALITFKKSDSVEAALKTPVDVCVA